MSADFRQVTSYYEVGNWIFWSDKGWVDVYDSAPSAALHEDDPGREVVIIPAEEYERLRRIALESTF
jgi:hypothetical protein